MPKKVNVNIENRLVTEKRDITIYHHSTRSSHILSHNSALSIKLGTDDEEDFLQISVVTGPGNLWNPCEISLPTWSDFELCTDGKVALKHTRKNSQIKLPPGPPSWDLKITRHPATTTGKNEKNVIVGDGITNHMGKK